MCRSTSRSGRSTTLPGCRAATSSGTRSAATSRTCGSSDVGGAGPRPCGHESDGTLSGSMRAARLHGIGDLRIESLDVPRPGARELVVRVEACGICPTDVRKYTIGSRDGYPLNPGHEWVGTVAEVGRDAPGWGIGQRVCGDTYAGYALLSIEPGAWSNGALAIPEDLDVVQATFVEPLADCVHAVQDQAQVVHGSRVCVVGAGQMGLQMVAVAAAAG